MKSSLVEQNGIPVKRIETDEGITITLPPDLSPEAEAAAIQEHLERWASMKGPVPKELDTPEWKEKTRFAPGIDRDGRPFGSSDS